MKHLRKFDSVSAMETAITASGITIVGMALDNNVPVVGRKSVTTPPAPVVDITTPLYIENISDESGTITIWQSNVAGQAYTLTIQKSTDASNWETVGNTSTTNLTIPIQAHSKIYLRCSTYAWGYFDNDEREEAYNCIKCNKSHNVGGNIFSLLYGASFTNQTTYRDTNWTDSEFGRLFYGDSDLVDAGDLILPTSAKTSSFIEMFCGCSKLNRIKCLFTSYPTSGYALMDWVKGVSANGTFIKSPEMTSWPRNANGIPSNWTVEDATV